MFLGLARSQNSEIMHLFQHMGKLEKIIFADINYKKLDLIERVGLLQEVQKAFKFRQEIADRAAKVDYEEVKTSLLKSFAGVASGLEELGVGKEALSKIVDLVLSDMRNKAVKSTEAQVESASTRTIT